jgi:hypothetical protein
LALSAILIGGANFLGFIITAVTMTQKILDVVVRGNAGNVHVLAAVSQCQKMYVSAGGR